MMVTMTSMCICIDVGYWVGARDVGNNDTYVWVY